jgi:hypothetical protein
MNGENQSQQDNLHVAERLARVETAVDYHDKIIAALREEMREGFARLEARMDAGFQRVDARFRDVDVQLIKIRTTDFRILLGICLTVAFSTVGLIIKVSGMP